MGGQANFGYDEKKNLPSGIGDVLYKWEGPEFEVYEKSKRWYIVACFFIFAIVAYALFTNSAIMAITFILIGIVGYNYSQKEPRIITFAITSKGVFADKGLYLYENIDSFCVFDEPGHKAVSLNTKASMLPFVHIPFDDEDPEELREALRKNISEIEQGPSMIDALERFFRI